MTELLPDSYRQCERAVYEQIAPQADWVRRDSGSALLHADSFTMALQEGWTNETTYVLEGPHTDGLQHTIQVDVDPNTGDAIVVHYANTRIEEQKESLNGCRFIKKEWTRLENGRRAYQALLSWTPTEGRRMYRDQLFVVHNGTGYRLAASFTKKTFKTLRPRVHRALHHFEPHAPLQRRRART